MNDHKPTEIEQLFEKARQNGGYEYLYTLVRIDGLQLQADYKDQLVVLRDWLGSGDSRDAVDSYRFLLSVEDPLKLLQNLVNNSNNKHYDVSPFRHLAKGAFPNLIWPTHSEMVSALAEDLSKAGFPALAEPLMRSCSADLLEKPESSIEEIKLAVHSLSELFKDLLNHYFKIRMAFGRSPKYLKLPDSLDILELLTDDEFGLIGLRVHFSQNCTADFCRTSKGVFGSNLEFGPPVVFLMMSMQPSPNEYRVNGKRLYEIGLPGRYNKLGEWKPLIYRAKSDHLLNECVGLSSDPDVQGILFYLRVTGHRCIEFVLRTNMELPGPLTSTREGSIHVWKCPPTADRQRSSHLWLYDCWLELQSGAVEEIEMGLTNIGRLVNLMCFPFGASYSWRNKYRTITPNTGTLDLSENDLEIADNLIKRVPDALDTAKLELATNWYNQGNISDNVFTKFLCYYIALESAALAIVDSGSFGDTVFGKPNETEKEKSTIECIRQKHRELFESDPKQFAIQSYFECVQTLTNKTKQAVTAVFGVGHVFYEWLFVKSSGDDIALSKLRSDLVHGKRTLLDKTHDHLVRKHIFEMNDLVRDFLMRIWFALKPSDLVPTWSGKFKFSLSTSDPRTTLVASTEKIFPKDVKWDIRPEWFDSL
jgi:hypothetical protein